MTGTKVQDLLLEIGTEELPATFVIPALEHLREQIRRSLDEARLDHGDVKAHGTPRRLAVMVGAVASSQEDRVLEVRGPPARAAFDKDGEPTRAAEGFAKGQGVQVESLFVVETPKGPYVAARVEERGGSAAEILPDVLRSIVAGMPFKKSMRWGEVGVAFARPIHWMVALLGERPIAFEYGDVRSGVQTRGHRFLAPSQVSIGSPADYLATLERHNVVCEIEERRRRILAGIEAAIAERNPSWRLRPDDGLLDEVTQLVEWPVAVVGGFDPAHLELPPEVLVSEMRQHQRYFSVLDAATGGLAPAFVAVSNTPARDMGVVRVGNERVLAARLADARYFYDTDRAQKLEERVEGLERVVFQEKLGSIRDKVRRIESLSGWLADRLGLQEKKGALERTVTLAKADLTTGMVGEFPELQGVMGRYYARADGEPEAVALGVEEHYLPRHAGDRLPSTDEGALAGIADRMDTLAGIFGIGRPPTGAADPFGLRRACLAVVAIVLGRGYRVSLSEMARQAVASLEERLKLDAATTQEKVMEFFRGRLKNLWTSQGHPVDVVEAVLSAGFDDLVSAHERVRVLSDLKGHPDFPMLAVAFARASNIASKAPASSATEVDPELFESDAERELWDASTRVKRKVDDALAGHDYRSALEEMMILRAPVDAFFESVLVMAEDERVRDNRLLLLRGIAGLFDRIADFSLIRSEGLEA